MYGDVSGLSLPFHWWCHCNYSSLDIESYMVRWIPTFLSSISQLSWLFLAICSTWFFFWMKLSNYLLNNGLYTYYIYTFRLYTWNKTNFWWKPNIYTPSETLLFWDWGWTSGKKHLITPEPYSKNPVVFKSNLPLEIFCLRKFCEMTYWLCHL